MSILVLRICLFVLSYLDEQIWMRGHRGESLVPFSVGIVSIMAVEPALSVLILSVFR